jgi:alkanesulfonate monooxygenase SsuD/methylene tetrahydromethanopterin reductase-like flavin-dependent oxidoreductase (luciferase family)
MHYALSLPNFDEHWHPRTLARLAQQAEGAGWDGFFIWDHILFDPYGGIAMSDPWVALAAIAMSTERIRVGTMVTPLARRRPWKVARETISLDHLSGGRLVLGVGLGDPAKEEFEWLGEESDARVRAAKLDEGLDVLTGLWTGEKFSYEGQHYQVKETVFLPPPVQSPRVPIWVGGVWPNKAPFRRAARWDGVVPLKWDAPLTPDELRDVVAYVHSHRAEETPLDVVFIGSTPGEDHAQGAAIVAGYADAGVTWWVEDVAMWRFRPYEPWKEPYIWPVEEIEERIRQGPPRFA